MKLRIVFACLLALSLGAAYAQDATQTPAHAHSKKASKPKKHDPEVIIIDPIDKTGAKDEESFDRHLFARAGVLGAFKFKKIGDISPAEIQGTADQLQVDFKNQDNWTPDNFDKLAEPWQASYVAAITVDGLKDASVDSSSKNPTITASADFTVWLYDVKNKKFIVDHASSHYDYKVKKGDDPVDPKSVDYEVIVDGAKEAFLSALKTKAK
jgi:hypothetical protein